MKDAKNSDKVTPKPASLEASSKTTKGPEPERLKIEGDWKKAVETALRKPKPPEGWPK